MPSPVKCAVHNRTTSDSPMQDRPDVADGCRPLAKSSLRGSYGLHPDRQEFRPADPIPARGTQVRQIILTPHILRACDVKRYGGLSARKSECAVDAALQVLFHLVCPPLSKLGRGTYPPCDLTSEFAFRPLEARMGSSSPKFNERQCRKMNQTSNNRPVLQRKSSLTMLAASNPRRVFPLPSS